MSPPRIFIIGCGIAGPVLAIFLKSKGYDPVLFDRLDGVVEAGVALMLQPNGLKVLGLIPGLVDRLPGRQVERFGFYSNTTNEVLAENSVPLDLVTKYGYGMIAVHRTSFHRVLVESAEQRGIKVHWGHQLTSFEQGEHDITVTFKNGIIDKASFVIGCDGLHSNTRIALFGKESPHFTGLIQTSGISPTPSVLAGKATMSNIFSVGEHMITYNISPTHSSWAISSPEAESKESWRAIDENQQAEFRSGAHSTWAFGAGELVRNAEMIVKYGLYDRPALEKWHVGRVVLLGDAAHPTTPHLGQGANQAFEDVYHLVRALVTYHTDVHSPLTLPILETIFSEYEEIRRPRSARLVKQAAARGAIRVVTDPVAASARDASIKKANADLEAVMRDFESVASGPYQGQSDI